MAHITIENDTTPPNNFLVFISVIVTIVLIAGVMVWTYYFYLSTLSNASNKLQDVSNRHPYISGIESQARLSLDAYGWVDKKKGIVQIPIDVAMQHVIQDYSSF